MTCNCTRDGRPYLHLANCDSSPQTAPSATASRTVEPATTPTPVRVVEMQASAGGAPDALQLIAECVADLTKQLMFLQDEVQRQGAALVQLYGVIHRGPA